MKKIIVGSRFSNLASLSPKVEVNDNNITKNMSNHIIFGQGIYNKTSIAENMHKNFMPERKEYTRKHRAENVIIGLVEKTADTTFKSQLLINNESEMILDHLSGFHIPSMILMEAARQVTAVVINKYLTTFDSTYAIAKKFNNQFNEFVFPFETQINVTIANLITIKTSTSFSIKIEFIQNNVNCALSELDIVFYREASLLALERRNISRLLNEITK